jgi:phosphotransferase system  glucose/maltose/N-acetylglucosamine-specific IIC component
LKLTTKHPLTIKTSIITKTVSPYFTSQGFTETIVTNPPPLLRVVAITLGAFCGIVFVAFVFYFVWKMKNKRTTHDPLGKLNTLIIERFHSFLRE